MKKQSENVKKLLQIANEIGFSSPKYTHEEILEMKIKDLEKEVEHWKDKYNELKNPRKE